MSRLDSNSEEKSDHVLWDTELTPAHADDNSPSCKRIDEH